LQQSPNNLPYTGIGEREKKRIRKVKMIIKKVPTRY
jgi:hypothetical protein